MKMRPFQHARTVLVASVLFASSFATASVSTGGDSSITLVFGEQATSLTVAPNAIEGANVRLHRRPNGLSGSALGSEVEVSWADERLEGRVGRSGLRLTLWQQATAGEELNGRFAEFPASLTVRPTRMEARLAQCRYLLVYGGEAYEGSRECTDTGVPAPVRLQLPTRLAELPERERMALLFVLLAADTQRAR